MSTESGDMISTLITTIDFAARKHKNQRRKDAEETPYINHPIGVAKILIDAGVKELSLIQAAILHDTIEDTDTSFEELENLFGHTVATIVQELTDDKLLEQPERKKLRIENAPKKSNSAKIVGMADKIYNLRDLRRSLPVGWTEERRNLYFQWAEKVVVHYYKANETLGNLLKEIFVQHSKDTK